MNTYSLIIYLLINSINSVSILNKNECDICDLNGYFIPSNGYQCFPNDNGTICTCPDHRLSTLNGPCRICQREGICGSSNITCSEESSIFQYPTATSYFVCFCSSDSFLIGKSCPIETTFLPSTTTTSSKETTEPQIDCPNQSSIKSMILKPLLAVIIFLVYLINI